MSYADAAARVAMRRARTGRQAPVPGDRQPDDDRDFWDEVDDLIGGTPAPIEEAQTWEDALHPRNRLGRWREKLGGSRLDLKGDKKLTKPQVHSRAKQVVASLIDFYGSDEKPEVHHEGEYLAANGTDARFRHQGETLAGVMYGDRIARDTADPDFGVAPLRIVAHEAAHALSGEKPGPLPGFSQTVEEGAAEVLSLWFWKHKGQPFDHRDAARVGGKWNHDLHFNVAYRKEVAEVLSRAASRVGWDREKVIDEVEAVMRGNHNDRIAWRDATSVAPPPPGGEPVEQDHTDGAEAVGLMRWLLSDDPAPAPESKLALVDRAYVAEGAMKRGGLTGRSWSIPVGKMEDGSALGSYGPEAQRASAWASQAAGFPVRVVASTYWPEDREDGPYVHASANYGMGSIAVRPETDDLTILHEVAHLKAYRETGETGHTEHWARTAQALYREHLGEEAGDTFGNLVLDPVAATVEREVEPVPEGTPVRRVRPPGSDAYEALHAKGVHPGSPGEGSRWHQQRRDAIYKTITDAVERYPVLTSSDGRKLRGVLFTSGNGLLERHLAQMLPHGTTFSVAAAKEWDHHWLVVNDQHPWIWPVSQHPDVPGDGGLHPATGETIEGSVWHEVGHMLMHAAGIDPAGDQDEREQAHWDFMAKTGIDFEDLDGLSTYAASTPLEGWAELTAAFHKRPDLLDDELRARAESLFRGLSKKGRE